MADVKPHQSSHTEHDASVSKTSIPTQGIASVFKNQPKAVVTAFSAALGGFLFGLEISYISPLMAMPSFKELMTGSAEIALSTSEERMAKGILYIGSMIVAMPFFSKFIMDKMGRRWNLITGSLLYSVGMILQAAAQDMTMFVIARFILGVGIAFILITAPIYSSETAPKEIRGMASQSFQVSIVLGQILAVLVCLATSDNENGFRDALWYIPCVACLYALLVFFLPESPRYYFKCGRYEEGAEAMRTLRKGAPEHIVEKEIAMVQEHVEFERELGEATFKELLSGYMLKLVIVGMVLQVLQQYTGMNNLIYYANGIGEQMGMSGDVFSTVLNACYLPPVVASLFLTEKYGRTFLLKWGGLTMCLAFIALGITGYVYFQNPDECWSTPTCNDFGCQFSFTETGIFTNSVDVKYCQHSSGMGPGEQETAGQVLAMIFIILFGFGFQVSWGPVAWAYCAEIFPLKYRTLGSAMCVVANQFANMLIVWVMPYFTDIAGWGMYFFYAGFCLLGFFYAFWLVETSGLSLESITSKWEKKLNAKYGGDLSEIPASKSETKPVPEAITESNQADI